MCFPIFSCKWITYFLRMTVDKDVSEGHLKERRKERRSNGENMGAFSSRWYELVAALTCLYLKDSPVEEGSDNKSDACHQKCAFAALFRHNTFTCIYSFTILILESE